MKVYRVKLEQYDRAGLILFGETYHVAAMTMERAIQKAKRLAHRERGDCLLKSYPLAVDEACEIVNDLR